MTDLLANASAWLDGRRKASLAQTVTYSRGAQSVEVAATAGQTDHEVGTADGYVETVAAADFILTAAELVLGGSAIEPAAGDRIVWKGETYEVLPPGGDRCFRYTDPHKTTIRVHTKRVAAA